MRTYSYGGNANANLILLSINDKPNVIRNYIAILPTMCVS